jgi:hypothetical protein
MMVRRKRARSLTEAIDRTSSAAISDTRTFATTSCRNNSSSSGVQRTFRFFDTPRSLICIHLQPDLASRVDFTRFDRNPSLSCDVELRFRFAGVGPRSPTLSGLGRPASEAVLLPRRSTAHSRLEASGRSFFCLQLAAGFNPRGTGAP